MYQWKKWAGPLWVNNRVSSISVSVCRCTAALKCCCWVETAIELHAVDEGRLSKPSSHRFSTKHCGILYKTTCETAEGSCDSGCIFLMLNFWEYLNWNFFTNFNVDLLYPKFAPCCKIVKCKYWISCIYRYWLYKWLQWGLGVKNCITNICRKNTLRHLRSYKMTFS